MTINKIPHFDPFSFAPELSKASVGFDDIFKRVQDVLQRVPKAPSYPPYNIRKVGENKYVIELALAGFAKQDVEIELKDGTLVIKGQTNTDSNSEEYLFKGIADRTFVRTFTLADHVEVKNADMINGMLKIWLEQLVPMSSSRKIEINEKG
jgi:molecular chaperone IbpA